MRIATAACPLDAFTSVAQYEDKFSAWVVEAAGNGGDLLVFPEYGAMELATLDRLAIVGDLKKYLFSALGWLANADALHCKLPAAYGVHIVAASGLAATQTRPVNRARLIAPSGVIGV